jgi:signal transduction histidine kinase
MLGYSREEIVGRPVASFLPVEDLPRLARTRDELLGGGTIRSDWTMLTKDGKALPVEVSAKILPEGRWLAFVRDISGRKELERQAALALAAEAKARAWLAQIIEQMPEGVVLAEPDGRISYNRAALALSDAGEFDVRSPEGVSVPLEARPALRALRGGIGQRAELVIHLGGREIPVVAASAPVVDASGAIIGAVTTIHDASAEKAVERLRDEWTSVIAHDLRQPISTIMLIAGAMRSGADESRLVGQLDRAARRLERMINDLLDFSRLEARRLSLEREPVDLPALVRELAERQSPDHEVVVRVPKAVERVLVDAARVEQVLNNLISNATKYGDPGEAIVVSVEPAGGEVRVAVTNRGAPIPREEQGRLFSRFHRGARRRGTEGIGLGLYICKGLVEAHGGRIWVTSEDETTTFTFTLPVAEGAPAHP